MNNQTSPENPDQQEIFLKEALEEQFSFKRLDQILVVIRRKDWIIYLAISIIVALFLLWTFIGSIPITASGKGVILDINQIDTLISQTEGTVESIYVDQGDQVKPGQLLVGLHNPVATFEYEFYQKQFRTVKEEYDALVHQIKNERIFRNSFLKEQASSLLVAKENKTKEIEIIKTSLSAEESLLQKNLLSLPTVNQTRLNLLAASTELESFQSKIKEIRFEQAKDYRQTEIWDKEFHLNALQRELGISEIRFHETLVISNDSGHVVSNLAHQGLYVTKGTPLIIVQKSSDPVPPRYFYAYVPSDIAKSIHPGMSARIELTKYLLKKYGYILGTVKEVSILPVTETHILAKLFNPNLVTSLKEASVGQVVVELDRDPNTPTGYHWSSGAGPKEPITIGNIGSVHVVVDRIAPIYFLIPTWIRSEACP